MSKQKVHVKTVEEYLALLNNRTVYAYVHLTNTKRGHNKFYEILCIESIDGTFCLFTRFGARDRFGAVHVEPDLEKTVALRRLHEIFRSKARGGYEVYTVKYADGKVYDKVLPAYSHVVTNKPVLLQSKQKYVEAVLKKPAEKPVKVVKPSVSSIQDQWDLF